MDRKSFLGGVQIKGKPVQIGQRLGMETGLRQSPRFPLNFWILVFLFMVILNAAAPYAFALNPFQESNGQVVMEAENYDAKVARSGKDWSFFSSAGTTASGTGYLQALPNTGTTNDTGYATLSPELKYQINFTNTGTYYIWIRGRGPTTSDHSIHSGVDGTTSTSADRMSGFPNSWTWSRSTSDGPVATVVVSTAGVHTFNLWMREDGFMVDKILLRKDSSSTAPSGTGPAESPRSGTNRAPVIASVTPAAGSSYYEQASVTVAVTASDPDGDALQYQYKVNGVVRQAWTSFSTYALASLDRNYGEKVVIVEVKDPSSATASSQTKIFFMRKPKEPPVR